MRLFGKKNIIDSNTSQIEEFLTRGLENVYPSKDALKKALSSGKKLSIYLGIDPTGPTLHMGHAIPLMKLSALQKMGHKAILLMGDFTAMIGDPTDKAAARKVLSRSEVLDNLKLYKKQASKFLSFSGSNAAEFKFNSKWLGAMSFEDVISLASRMTVQQMLERDMFEKRLEEKKPIYIHEFLYPLMQGYDSVAMDVDAEVGGNDQTFNMLTGRDLMRSIKNKEKFVIATKLLVDPTGKKMGKSEGNMITMLDSAENMFGKVMSWPDDLIVSGFELCTRVSPAEIAKEKSALEAGSNPRDSKMKLAAAVVEVYYGKEAGEKAKDSFISAFSQGTMKADAPETEAKKGDLIVEALISAGVVASRTEFRRLADAGAITDMKTNEKITKYDVVVQNDIDLKVGKHRFIKIKVK
jgi:tyrosyl-tRNA synthetase